MKNHYYPQMHNYGVPDFNRPEAPGIDVYVDENPQMGSWAETQFGAMTGWTFFNLGQDYVHTLAKRA